LSITWPNLIRAFGPSGWRDKWAKITLAEMKRLRFNTVANWSEWEYSKAAGFPYVRPMDFMAKRSGWIYRDFPDVYHSEFEVDAADFAAGLSGTATDPAFIGYFLMNEPTWGFSSELPAVGMLYNTASCSTRTELSRFLKKKYPDDLALAGAWKMPVTFARVQSGKWQGAFTTEAQDDLRDFTVLMVERYFSILSACRKVDRTIWSRHALGRHPSGRSGVDSSTCSALNCYREKLPLETGRLRNAADAVMVGEYHFGALDAGLPALGIGHLRTRQTRRNTGCTSKMRQHPTAWVSTGLRCMTNPPSVATLGAGVGFFDVYSRARQLGQAAIASLTDVPIADGRTAFEDVPGICHCSICGGTLIGDHSSFAAFPKAHPANPGHSVWLFLAL
jgi:hypothetical protein